MMNSSYVELEGAIRSGGGRHVVPDWAELMLDDVATGRLPVAAVRHPLGFLCFPLYRDGDDGICVHVWSADIRVELTTSSMHCHSWHMLSYVLYGTLRNDTVRLVDDPRAAQYRVFRVQSRADVDEIRATPRLVRCESRSTEQYGAGQTYELAAGDFHQSVLLEGPAATLVLGRRQLGAGDFALAVVDTATHVVRRKREGGEVSRDVARMAAERLAGVRPTPWPADRHASPKVG
jgi:hypothetical protein